MITFPRFTRPDTIAVKHKTGEDTNGASTYETTTINYVKFEYKATSSQSTMQFNKDKEYLVTIDLSDYKALKSGKNVKYVNKSDYSVNSNQFTIDNGDVIAFGNVEVSVHTVNEISPFGDVLFIEVS